MHPYRVTFSGPARGGRLPGRAAGQPERDRSSGRFRRRHTNRYCLRRPAGRPSQYRPGQHRVYRVASLRALQQEAETSTGGQNAVSDLQDTGVTSTPDRGEPNPAPAPPGMDNYLTSPPAPNLAAPDSSSATPANSTNTPPPHREAPVCGPLGASRRCGKHYQRPPATVDLTPPSKAGWRKLEVRTLPRRYVASSGTAKFRDPTVGDTIRAASLVPGPLAHERYGSSDPADRHSTNARARPESPFSEATVPARCALASMAKSGTSSLYNLPHHDAMMHLCRRHVLRSRSTRTC